MVQILSTCFFRDKSYALNLKKCVCVCGEIVFQKYIISFLKYCCPKAGKKMTLLPQILQFLRQKLKSQY
jgi:hypothetical protein